MKKHIYHDCTKDNCGICNGGLLLCTVCGGAESTLQEECPGRATPTPNLTMPSISVSETATPSLPQATAKPVDERDELLAGCRKAMRGYQEVCERQIAEKNDRIETLERIIRKIYPCTLPGTFSTDDTDYEALFEVFNGRTPISTTPAPEATPNVTTTQIL